MENKKKKRRLTCIDSDGGVPTSGTVNCARYGRAHERAEGEYGEVHARSTADICRVTECDHRRTDECCERPDRRSIDQRECDERARPMHVWPEECQYSRNEYRGYHDIQRTCSLSISGLRGPGTAYIPMRSAMKPLNKRPKPEPALAIATR